MFDIVIIGGGASGLMAAVQCKNKGMSVAIIESNDRVGKKVLATGNGKCNFTNASPTVQAYNTERIDSILARYNTQYILDKFYKLGVLARSIGEYYYPYSEQASSILNALRLAVDGCEMMLSTRAQKILPHGEGYKVITDNGEVLAKRVCIATGSHATMGQDSGYLAQSLGCKLKEFTPSLLPINVDKDRIRGMQGVRCKVALTLTTDGAKHIQHGEILFKERAVSGIAAFILSAYLARGSGKGELSIDFAPEYDREQLTDIVKSVGVDNIFHKSIVQAVKAGAITIKDIVENIKNYTIDCTANRDVKQAQACSGGIDIDEINLDNMQLYKAKGVYAIGEAVDVDGICGGYNLHWAWASALCMADSL